jgi:hypothetical protein
VRACHGGPAHAGVPVETAPVHRISACDLVACKSPGSR